MVTFSIRIDARIVAELDAIAVAQDRTRNRIIEHLLAQGTGLPVFRFQELDIERDEDNGS